MLSILLLPFVAVAIVPYWLLTSFPVNHSSWSLWIFRVAGGATILFGLALFIWCVSLFARVGQGTLAPWDPTQKLVAVGPYRFVRNPMIASVAFLLIGEALLWGSQVVGVWAGVFILVNHIYFIFLEEPGLDARFGESYRLYKANVPRWLPRVKPWLGE